MDRELTAAGADPITRVLLDRFMPDGRVTPQPDFLPELSRSALLALLSARHRQTAWVGFPEPMADAT